jgi:carbonyl reductase 1
LDVLINNAGIASKGNEVTEEMAKNTIGTNYFSLKNVTLALLPLLSKNGRIVNVSSTMGILDNSNSKDLKEKYLLKDLGFDDIDKLANDFIEGVKNENYKEKGYPSSTYKVSKSLVNAFTRVLKKSLEKDERNLIINCCCPGKFLINVT